MLTSPRDDCVQAWFEAPLGAALLGWRLFRCDVVGLLDQSPARATLLRPAHPADPHQLLRRQHLALPPHRSGVGHRARQPGSLVFRFGAKEARRAAHLRQLSAAAAAAQIADAGQRADSLSTGLLRQRDQTHRRQSDRSDLRRVLRAQALLGQPRQPRWAGAAAGCKYGQGPVQHRRSAQSTADRPEQPGVSILHRAGRRAGQDPGVVRVRHLPQLAAVRLLHDLRRRRYAEAVQLQPRRQLRRRDGDRRRAERDPAAPAGARRRRREPHRRRLLQLARRRRLEIVEGLGRAGPGKPALHADQERGPAILRGQRDAQAPAARVRARRVPQPRRLQRLPPALGRAGLLLAVRARAQLRDGAEGVHRARHHRHQAVARDQEDHLPELGRHDPPRGAGARRLRPRVDHRRFGYALRRGLRPDDGDRFLRVQRVASHRTPGPRGRRLADGERRRDPAGVRVAPAQRRQFAAVRHLRGRRGSQDRRRGHGRRRPEWRRSATCAPRARPVRRGQPDRGRRRTRPRNGATTAPSSSSRRARAHRMARTCT